MKHEELQANIPAFALGALDEGECTPIRQHLRSCAECSELLASYSTVPAALNAAVEEAAVPSGFTERLLERASAPAPEPRRFKLRRGAVLLSSRAGWAAAAACLVLALLSGGWAWKVTGELAEQREYDAKMAALMARPDVTAVNLSAVEPAARGRLYLSPERDEAVIMLSRLPRLPEGRVYQVWLISRQGRQSAGTYVPLDDGSIRLYLGRGVWNSSLTAVGVTVEPEGGSLVPSTPRIIGGSVS